MYPFDVLFPGYSKQGNCDLEDAGLRDVGDDIGFLKPMFGKNRSGYQKACDLL